MAFERCAIAPGWGADAITVFTAARLAALMAGAAAQTRPLGFLWRYGADVSLEERDVIVPACPLLLVEHVRRPGWQSGGAAGGEAAGKLDVFHAQRLSYPSGSHLGFDLEGLGDVGAPVEAYVLGRCKVTRGEGFPPASYEGYDDGLTMALREAISGSDGVDVWWSDYGPRTPPPGIGFVMTQHPQVSVGGTMIDWDECHGVDLRGRQIFGMRLAGDPNIETPDLRTTPTLRSGPP